MRILMLSLLVLSLSACQLLYRLPTRQGNLLDQRDLAKLEIGMTREQVKFLLGAPVASNPFRDDRWDYLSYYKAPRGDVTKKTITLFFENERVSKIEGLDLAKAKADAAAAAAIAIDAEANKNEDKKLKLESQGERPDAGEGTGDILQPTPGGTP